MGLAVGVETTGLVVGVDNEGLSEGLPVGFHDGLVVGEKVVSFIYQQIDLNRKSRWFGILSNM